MMRRKQRDEYAQDSYELNNDDENFQKFPPLRKPSYILKPRLVPLYLIIPYGFYDFRIILP